MKVGGKDHPSMLAHGNYVHWKSLIKRYIDTKPDRELIHYCLENAPYKYQYINTSTTPGIDGPSPTQASRVMETYATVLEENRKKIDAEAKVIQIILTGIDNDIYSKIDACPNAMEMWKAIERLKQDADDNSRPIFDTEPLEHVQTNVNYNMFANEKQHPEQPESINNTYVMQKDDRNITPDSSNMCNDEGEVDHDTTAEESALLASLIANLKLEIDGNKRINKDPEKANMSLNSELTRYKESNYVKEVDDESENAYGLVKEQNDKSNKYCSEAAFQVFNIKQKVSELEKTDS
nr:hypothetical protein [Tanacetum cinerariifolium]